MAHDHDGFGPAYVSPDPEYAVTPPGAGYEHTDANVWIIIKFGLWLAISAAIVHVGIGFMFGLFVDQRQVAVPQFPLDTSTEIRLPAEPRLQRFPVNEAYQFRLQESAALDSYGWVDREAGTVQIPVAEAMRLLVERGLPARAAAPEQAPGAAGAAAAVPMETPGLMPADSSSGRTMERRRQ
jgi:hypothetical protein